MTSFQQFLADAAGKGLVVNTLFEERLFGLVGVLHRISDALSAAKIPHELIGGLAVLIHVEEANPEYSTLTRDVDLMVRRGDLQQVMQAAATAGFQFRHAAGGDMLLAGNDVKNAIHLIFSEEKVRPNYLAAAPAIEPEDKVIHGKAVKIIPVRDLLRMKLTSFRDEDRVHVRSLDAAGLITNEVESGLTEELAGRLRIVRETE